MHPFLFKAVLSDVRRSASALTQRATGTIARGLSTRSGFRMMEVHGLYFRHMLPWWNDVVTLPESKMPKTMKCLENNFVGEEKEKRRAQMLRGLHAGRNELIEMTTPILLDGPVSFLILCN